MWGLRPGTGELCPHEHSQAGGHAAHHCLQPLPQPQHGAHMAWSRFLPVLSVWKGSKGHRRGEQQQPGNTAAPGGEGYSPPVPGHESPHPVEDKADAHRASLLTASSFLLCLTYNESRPERETHIQCLPSHAEFRACGHGEETVCGSPMMGHETFHPEVMGDVSSSGLGHC